MMVSPVASGFGLAWLAFALALAIHVADEAAHDFLAVYNPTALAIRSRLPFLPVPTFSFPVWLGGLVALVILLLLLSPLAFHDNARLRVISWPLAVLVGIGNAVLHIASSAFQRRKMPGVYSAPLLLIASVYLIVAITR